MGSLKRESSGTAHKGEVGLKEAPAGMGCLPDRKSQGQGAVSEPEEEQTTGSRAVGQRVMNLALLLGA